MLSTVDGQTLREWRERHGLRQTELAELLHIDHNTVFRWEKGTRNPPAGIILDRALRDIEREIEARKAD